MTKRLFISVGSRLPMERLLKSADEFLARHSGYTAYAQTGQNTLSLKHIQSKTWLDSKEFESSLLECDIFISHAGMGNILLASQHGKPIIVMPRLAALGEHINDHQLATVNGLQGSPNLFVTNDAFELEQTILSLSNIDPNEIAGKTNNNSERAQLIEKLKHFIEHGTV